MLELTPLCQPGTVSATRERGRVAEQARLHLYVQPTASSWSGFPLDHLLCALSNCILTNSAWTVKEELWHFFLFSLHHLLSHSFILRLYKTTETPFTPLSTPHVLGRSENCKSQMQPRNNEDNMSSSCSHKSSF